MNCVGIGLRGVKLDASVARLHGPVLVRIWFVSDQHLTSTNTLI
jgi:hypothetical protein